MKYIVKHEAMGGTMYWMIYQKWLCFESFFERWNTAKSCCIRMAELTKKT